MAYDPTGQGSADVGTGATGDHPGPLATSPGSFSGTSLSMPAFYEDGLAYRYTFTPVSRTAVRTELTNPIPAPAGLGLLGLGLVALGLNRRRKKVAVVNA